MKKTILLFLSLLTVTFVNAQLSGTYSINSNASQNPNYTSFSAAISALSAGVSGPVVFEVAPGTYEEYVTLGSINGTSENNRVIFRGLGADNQQVVVTSNAGYTDNSTLKFNGADYITFENMTVTTTSTAKALLLRFDGQCDYDRFDNVRFVGVEVPSNSSDNDKNLVHMNDGDGIVNHDTQFVGCQFINGCIALYVQGKNMTQFNEGVLIENCYFENQQFKSIYPTFYNNVVIRGNTIVNANDFKTDYNAIDIFQCYNGAIIENNVMNVTRTTSYSTVFRIRPLVGTEEHHVIIRNNIVNLQANANSYAFAIDYNQCAYIDFAHNTLKCTGTGENINIFVQMDGTNFNFHNNLLVNETNGYVFRFNKNISSRNCDYNRIVYSGQHLGRFTTTDCATLSDWTATSGFDTNSALCTPEFVGTNDLHITNSDGLTVAHPLSYVTTDIDGESRSSTTPCAGADEYASGTNLPPVVANPIDNVVFETYPASQTISLANTFSDPDDPDDDIVIELTSNSNPTLVAATLSNRTLTVTRLASTGGTATITLNAESAGQSVETSFSVECIAEDQPPYVANPLAPIHFTEYPQTLYFDLDNVFDDPDNSSQFIVCNVQSCSPEISALITDNQLTVSRTTPNAFSNKSLVIRATSNGLYVDMNVTVSGAEVEVNGEVADFEDVVVGPNGYWETEDGSHNMLSGAWVFTHYYNEDYMFWGGFSTSNHTDLSQVGLNAQYTAITGGGYEGSAQYAVAYTMGAQTEVSAADGQAHTVTGCYVTNNLWAYQDMVEGEYNVTPFGGTTGNDPDWFKLTATGKNAAGQTVGTVDFYLADYRFSNSNDDYILDTWEWFDLSSLGEVSKISFSLTSSKNNSYGMITPAYFCMDNFNGIGPDAPDIPPYVANPVADIVFNDYPQTIQVNLTGVATDPDDPDEDIAYSIVSNSNPASVAVSLENNVLSINRLTNTEEIAELVLRATSNGQSVDFNIHVMLHHYIDVDENQVSFRVFPNPSNGVVDVETSYYDVSTSEIRVYDLMGQLVDSRRLEGAVTTIDLRSCPKGIYFVTLLHDGFTHIEKIIIY